MSLETVRSVLGWCSIINFGFLLYWFGMFALAHSWVYRCHTKWFTLSEERFDEIHYTTMAYFKLTVIVFNVVPYLALRIVG